jgi:hypothetical protein
MSLKWWEQVLMAPSQLSVRVDRNVDRLRAAESADMAFVTYQLNELRRELSEKIVEVAQLRCALSSLTQLLVERGVLDEASIKVRFDEAVSELSRASMPPPVATEATGSPYRDAPPSEEEPPPKLVQCQGCGKTVLAARSNVTARGILCDACYGVC